VSIAILDPFSGIAGDMMLGALIHVGLDPEWLRGLPDRLGLQGVGVQIADVRRGGIACKKVDFTIPPQPHGRHIKEIRSIVERSGAPEPVRRLADQAFTAIAEVEGAIHGVTPERVHLHEVGAVDAILDVVGSIWGVSLLDIDAVYCGPVMLGDGFVRAAHGVIPVPAPATLKLLEGHPVRPGPEGAGELVTPTGAALVRVLSKGPPPDEYTPTRSGFGAGTKEFSDRANALRIVVGELAASDHDGRSALVMLSADIDDMTPEHVSAAVDALRGAGALDVVCLATLMKKGRPGTRIEVLSDPSNVDRLEALFFQTTTTIGIRRAVVERRALPRETQTVRVLGHDVRLKLTTLPDGRRQAKPEFDDVRAVAQSTGRSVIEITSLAFSSSGSERG
jgi:pyridinium-3,5-bisthiocarboxylic acid mononucleotide nickel chelatase